MIAVVALGALLALLVVVYIMLKRKPAAAPGDLAVIAVEMGYDENNQSDRQSIEVNTTHPHTHMRARSTVPL